MNCSRCGKDNPDGSQFCNGCGSVLTAPSPQYQAAMNPDRASALRLILFIMAGFVVIYSVAWIGGTFNSKPSDSPSSNVSLATNTSEPQRPDFGPSVIPPQPEILPAKLRENLLANYRHTIATANPYLNFIKSKATKMKGGYALWVVHSAFTQSSFDYGDDVKVVQKWISEHSSDLSKAEVKRVGFKNESGYLGECRIELK